MWRLLRELSIRSSIPKQTAFARVWCYVGQKRCSRWQAIRLNRAVHCTSHNIDFATYSRTNVRRARGSRSFGAKNNDPLEVFVLTSLFGAKNNDPLEVFVLTSLFESLFWFGWSVRDQPQRRR